MNENTTECALRMLKEYGYRAVGIASAAGCKELALRILDLSHVGAR